MPDSTGPAYPLSREEFRRALATGHGRAWIHVERFGAAEFRDEILEAATVCKVYDAQCEGTRAEWLAELCLSAGIGHEVVALPVPDEFWDREHRASLLKELTARDVAGAREALYACFGRAEHSCDVHALEQIIALDGAAGLLFVARQLGVGGVEGWESWISTYHLDVFDELFGEGSGRRVLESGAQSDSNVRAYLEAVDADRANDTRNAARPADARRSLEYVLETIRTKRELHEFGWLGSWGRRAPRDELQQVLSTLLTLTEPRALEAALRCLGGATLPLLDPRIFELTKHEDRDVRYWAARVLSKHSLPGVRVFGLEALARGDMYVALEILTRSAQVDDTDTLIAALRPVDDPDQEHGSCSGVLDILEHCPEVRDSRLALHVFERTPCMQCREKAVCFLVRRKQAPQWLLEECAFDGAEDIRELAAGFQASRPPPPAVSC